MPSAATKPKVVTRKSLDTQKESSSTGPAKVKSSRDKSKVFSYPTKDELPVPKYSSKIFPQTKSNSSSCSTTKTSEDKGLPGRGIRIGLVGFFLAQRDEDRVEEVVTGVREAVAMGCNYILVSGNNATAKGVPEGYSGYAVPIAKKLGEDPVLSKIPVHIDDRVPNERTYYIILI